LEIGSKSAMLASLLKLRSASDRMVTKGSGQPSAGGSGAGINAQCPFGWRDRLARGAVSEVFGIHGSCLKPFAESVNSRNSYYILCLNVNKASSYDTFFSWHGLK